MSDKPSSGSPADQLPEPIAAAATALSAWADSRWLFPAVLALTVAGLFFDALGPDCVFAYRDSLHFYPPLYRLVREEWLAGRVPLWNPLLNCGQPLAAMGTAGAFYPPQLAITMLLPDGVSLNIYCIAHLALAATGAYCLARDQGCSRPAATVAGLAYGFCGSVFLQIYNPIYAAGAAWLVWAVRAGLRLLERGGLRDGLLLAAALAMAVFCGDPQAAYHAGIVLGLVWLCLPGRSWRGLGFLAAAGLAGGALALVQVALTAEFMRGTSRAIHAAPHSIWEIPAFLARPSAERAGVAWYDVLIGRPPAGDSHHAEQYGFSVFPWQVLELVWADFAGTTFYRWPVMLGIDKPDAWSHSLYAGVVPVAAAIAAAVVPRSGGRSRRLWWVVLGWAALASIGGLGIVGLGRNIAAIATGRWQQFGYRAGDEVGGLFWAMSILLPGYGGFRYPAKWMTVFALALSQLAGIGATRLAEPRARVAFTRATGAIGLWALAGLLLLLGAAAIVGADDVLPGSRGDGRRWLAWWAVVRGGALAAAVAAAGVLAMAAVRRHDGHAVVMRAAPVALALLAAIDLVVAGRGGILIAPYSDLVAGSGYLASLAAAQPQAGQGSVAHPRVYVIEGQLKFADTRDPRRFVRYTAILGRSHVPWLHGAGIVSEISTAMPADLERLYEPRRIDGRLVPPRRVLDLAGAEYFVVSLAGLGKATAKGALSDWSSGQKRGGFEGATPRGEPLPTQPLWLPGEEDDAPVALVVHNTAALPRARIVREVEVRPPGSPTADEIAIPSPETPDLMRRVIVEADSEAEFALPPGSGTRPAVDDCRMVVDEPQRTVVEATLAAPGLIVVADTFHPDWHALVETDAGPARPLPILRANGMHRAVSLPAGRHRVEFRHHSQTFFRSAAITLAAWAIWAAALAVSPRRPHDSRREAL